MKKGFSKILLTIICSLTMVFCLQANKIFANSKTYTSEYASYTEEEIIETNDLGYNIIHNKIKAISTANTCSNPKEGFSLTDSPQQVNMLTVPSTGNVRIVNYTFPNSSGWTKQTLSKLVQSFELTNPGWVVLAGVNGDFYDINGNDHALKYHTTGSTVSNGDVLRAVEKKSIGYTNNGTSNSFKIVDNAEFTSYHILTIYDNEGNIIKTFNVDKINEEPTGEELAVYYTYKVNNGTSADLVSVNVPNTNSYISEYPIRCLPTSEPEVFAKGEISTTNVGMELRFGQFAIVTNNEEIKSYLSIGTTIRVQKDVIGELADCDQVMGAGSTLVENGAISQNNSDGMRTDRHPRTCIGVKEDGTLMFFVIDGRQESAGYNGMTQDEMGTMMAYYGCYNGVNVDGGGSSTFGIRDEYGNFVIQNKPSDGNERTNSNALLIVVPQIQLQKSNIKDDSIKLSYNKPLGGIEVNNILVTINGITKEMTSNEFIFDGLEPETEYEMSYTYDLTYNGDTSNINGETFKFKTGKVGPNVEYAYFDINNNNVNLSFKTSDINQLTTFACIDYTDDIVFLDNFGETKINIKLSNVEKFDFKIEMDYSAESVPNNNGKITYNFKWYPLNVILDEFANEKIEAINNVIDQTNTKLESTDNKTEEINIINLAKSEINIILTSDAIKEIDDFVELNLNIYSSSNKELILGYVNETKEKLGKISSFADIEEIVNELFDKISTVKTYEEELFEYKNTKTEELNSYNELEKYSETNKGIITEYINDTKENILSSKTLEEIDVLIEEMYDKISKIKTLKQEEDELNQYKKDTINKLNQYLSGKVYSKKNQKLVVEIVKNAIDDINSSKAKDEVDSNYNNSLNELKNIKTKGCTSNTIIIYTSMLSLFTILYVLLKKSK